MKLLRNALFFSLIFRTKNFPITKWCLKVLKSSEKTEINFGRGGGHCPLLDPAAGALPLDPDGGVGGPYTHGLMAH